VCYPSRPVKIDVFDYELPESAIAQRPAEQRERARMLVLDGAALEHRSVGDFPDLLPPGALVVLNDTSVIKARLLGHKRRGGGKAELLLVRPLGDADPAQGQRWYAIGKGLGALAGQELVFGEGRLVARVEGPSDVDGLFMVTLSAAEGVDATIERVGKLPIPPYIKRVADQEDEQRYQTVFARVPGAVAAPTAGLHITDSMLARLAARGVETATITLHVGLGTFLPVTSDDLDQHVMHAEWMRVAPAVANRIAAARERGAPVIALGTTVARALESAADPERAGQVRAFEGDTDLLIQPGYRFKVVDGLLTNFHLPRSTLLAMVAAFAGTERVLAAYARAIELGYRFYSYGDAMWIPPPRAPR
jgi:S-adenosylmethionine:tRNA ribosyltransferase-isomerase